MSKKKYIEAIPTFYNGVTFRSRNEAKVAVFLYEAGIQYAYEPTHINREFHIYYTIDFYLPECNWFLEVKPKRYYGRDSIKLTHEAQAKAKLLAEHADIHVAFCFGINWKPPLINNMVVVDSFGDWYDDFQFKQCAQCNLTSIYSKQNRTCTRCNGLVSNDTRNLKLAKESARLMKF